MCRFVILAVIAASFISCVLAQAAETGTFNRTNCQYHEKMTKGRAALRRCFNTTVELHLNSSAILASGDCRNASDFGHKLDTYFSTLNEVCHLNLTIDTTNIVKIIDYSLSNDSFKSFNKDRKCVENKEYTLSNTCVKGNVGFFNITREKKHTSWYQKTNVVYNENTCPNSFLVKNCVAATLQPCKLTTTEYVKGLFDYVRNLGNCSRYPETATLPPPGGSVTPASAPWLTLPVIITLSIGAVVVVGAVITIIVLKCKNK